jgi:hypothetical protein
MKGTVKKENYQLNCMAQNASVFICIFIAAAFALNRYIQMQMFMIDSSVSKFHTVCTKIYCNME